MKIDDKISLAERKLEETKVKFEADKADLTSLIKQRAKLEAEAVLENKRDTKRITEIERQRDRLRSQIEIYPDLIKEVEAKIGALRKEKEDGILKENLARQRKVAKEIEEKSRELVATLGKADEINTSLGKLWEQCSGLAKLTNQSMISPHVTGGSQGTLRQLYGILKWEVVEGKSRPSPRFPPPGPPI
jgi:myosin heavy subunit